MVSGNSVEQQLRGLQRDTVYTVKALSQKDSLQSTAITTTFTTASGEYIRGETLHNITCNYSVEPQRSEAQSYGLTGQSYNTTSIPDSLVFLWFYCIGKRTMTELTCMCDGLSFSCEGR
jgi:hypothetical protein